MNRNECILPRGVADRMIRDARERFPELFVPSGAPPIVVTIHVNDANRARIDRLAEGTAARIRDDLIAAARGEPTRAQMKPAKVVRVK